MTATKEWDQDIITTSAGGSFTYTNIEEPCDAYNLIGVDGSLVTGFTADYVDDEVDISIPSDWLMGDMYAWWKYNLTTQQGMKEFWKGITAEDEANFRIEPAIVDIFLDNLTAINTKQNDIRRIYRNAPNQYPVKNDGVTTGGGGLDVNWQDKVLATVVTVGGVNVITGDIGDIKPQIDTTLANTNRVDGLIENNGGDRFTQKALEEAPSGGGGSSDWTDPEKEQIRDALGVDGDKTAATGGQLQEKASEANATTNTNNIITEVQAVEGISETDFHNYQDSYANKDTYKADTTGLATQTDINNQTADIKGADDRDLTEVYDNTPDVNIDEQDIRNAMTIPATTPVQA